MDKDSLSPPPEYDYTAEASSSKAALQEKQALSSKPPVSATTYQYSTFAGGSGDGNGNGESSKAGASLASQKIDKLRRVTFQYEISENFAKRLRRLEGFDIVLVCDDSGSMLTPIPPASAFGPAKSRWEELRFMAEIIMSIGSALDQDGIDIYFLNRPPVRNVHDEEVLHSVFERPPSGGTPLVPALRRVVQDKEFTIQEKKLLIIAITDGEPTDYNHQPDVRGFKNWLKSYLRPNGQIHMEIVACTDDLRVVQMLNSLDKDYPNFDVCDDFQSEKREILKARGRNFTFSFGDYIVKLLLGSIDRDMDRLDQSESSCCQLL